MAQSRTGRKGPRKTEAGKEDREGGTGRKGPGKAALGGKDRARRHWEERIEEADAGTFRVFRAKAPCARMSSATTSRKCSIRTSAPYSTRRA